MRTTNNMLINNMVYYMTNNMDRLSNYQTQMATGKKISRPSDDPVAAARALKYRTDVSEVTQFQKNAGDATSWMDTTESTLNQLGEILQTMHERAVQAANDTLTSEDRGQIMMEIQQLRDQAIHLANATYAGRYVFSGYSTDTKLMNDDGTYAVSVSSDKTAVIKSSLLDLSAAPLTIGADNERFEISINGGTYVQITVAGGPYDGSDGHTLDDLAAAIQSEINDETGFENINVKNAGGRLEFSLKVTTDTDGNKQAIYLREFGGDNFLKSIKVKTEGIPGIVSSKSEDINYQMGIGDMLNVNVLGTDLFGSGVEGDMGEFILKVNRFIDALSYSDDRSYISSQSVAATVATPLDFSSGGFQFDISVDGGTAITVDIPPLLGPIPNTDFDFDGSTGHTITELTNYIQGELPPNVTVAYQNGRIVFSADPGHQITLTEGATPGKDALKMMKIYTNADRTVTSVTGQEGMQNAMTDMSDLLNITLSVRSDIGARMNRAELTSHRLSSDELNFTKLMSDNEDVDMAELIMNMTNEENVYKASLSAGARIIQPSLIDFLK